MWNRPSTLTVVQLIPSRFTNGVLEVSIIFIHLFVSFCSGRDRADGGRSCSPPSIRLAYQRCVCRWPPPPLLRYPPPPRASFGLASLIVNVLPLSSRPLSASMAFWPSPSLAISTKAKP